MNFTKNQIKDFSGDIMDYSYFYNSKNFDGSGNEEYAGDSSSFLDKIFDFVKNLWGEYVDGKNSVKYQGNVDNNKNTGNSTSGNNTTDDSRDDIKNNSTDSNGDSDVGDSLDKSYSHSNRNSPGESESNVGDVSSGSGSTSSHEVHELEKSNVSKDISDVNYLIWIVLVIIAVFVLLAIGYKKK